MGSGNGIFSGMNQDITDIAKKINEHPIMREISNAIDTPGVGALLPVMGTMRMAWSPRGQKKLLDELLQRGMSQEQATQEMFNFSKAVNNSNKVWHQYDPISELQFYLTKNRR